MMMATQEAKMQLCSSIADFEISLHNDEHEMIRTLAIRTKNPDIYPHGYIYTKKRDQSSTDGYTDDRTRKHQRSLLSFVPKRDNR